jgi:hypothetical protein
MSQEIEVLDQNEIQAESVTYPIQARLLAGAIKDDASYQAAGSFLLTIKGFRKKVEEVFGPVVQKANQAWKAALDLRKQADAPLDEAERIIKPALAAYDQEQERKRREEQERLMAEQKKRDDDSRLAQAEKAAKNGDLKAANAILEAPASPIVAPALQPKAQVAGISYSQSWKAECTDIRALVLAVAQGKASITLLEANQVGINQMARALKSEFQVPGIRVWSEKVVSSKSK